MTLSLIAVAILAAIMFLFVLEPVLRARGDRVVLDAAALPRRDESSVDDDPTESGQPLDTAAPPSLPALHQPGGRVASNQTAGGDVT
jgi:hypothetical protein